MARGVVGRDTGVFAPRLTAARSEQGAVKPTFVSADRSEQRAAGPTIPSKKVSTKTPVNPKALQPNPLGNFPYPTYEMTGQPSPEATGNAIFDAINNFTNTPTGGGGVSNPYTDAIRLLQQEIAGGKYGTSYVDAIKLLEQRIAGGQYGTSYDDSIKIIQDQIDSGVYGKPFNRLSNQLSSTGLIAKQDIDAASANAVRALSRRDPMAGYSYEPSTAQIPQAALSNYLTSIGAGTNEVDANRNFLQSMIESENAQTQQYTNAVSQAQNAQRDAAIQGVYGNQAYSQSQLSSAQQAQEFAIKAAREAELKKLTDQILGYTTQEATSKSEDLKTLQDQILGYTAQGETSKAEALRNLQDQILQYSLKGGKTSTKKKSGKK